MHLLRVEQHVAPAVPPTVADSNSGLQYLICQSLGDAPCALQPLVVMLKWVAAIEIECEAKSTDLSSSNIVTFILVVEIQSRASIDIESDAVVCSLHGVSVDVCVRSSIYSFGNICTPHSQLHIAILWVQLHFN